ncbi:MAG: hypothetical protein WEB13_09170 [Dehalococcoidia bacterium]
MRYVIPLMAVYLALMTGLAIKYDWRFLWNDVIALLIFAVMAIGLLVYELPRRRGSP